MEKRTHPRADGAVDWVPFRLHAYDTSGQLLGVAQVNQHGPIYVNHPRERHVPPVSVGINADGNIAVAYTIDQLFTGWVRTFNANAEPLMDETSHRRQPPPVDHPAGRDEFVLRPPRGLLASR